MSLDRRMDKEDAVYMYLALRKKTILPFLTTWLDPEGIMLSELNQAEEDKYYLL